MKLADLLSPERIILPLEARSLDEAVAALASGLPGSVPSPDLDALREGAGGEIRDPSPRTLLIVERRGERPTAAVAVSRDPITDREGRAIRLILFLRTGKTPGISTGRIDALVSVLSDPEVESALLTANAVEDVLAVERLMKLALRGQRKVRDALTPMSYRIYPDTPLGEVADLMARKNLAAVPVVGEGLQVLGIITSGEALRQTLQDQGRGGAAMSGIRARDVMSRAVLCVTEDQDLVDAGKMMANRDLAQLPVVREGEMIGFLTREAVLRALLSGSE